MAKYDPNLLLEFADRLTAKAASAVLNYTLMGLVLGIVGAFLIHAYSPVTFSRGAIRVPIFVLVGGVGALLGAILGRGKSFQFRLEAQKVLCALVSEKQTRGEPGPATIPEGARTTRSSGTP
jgi:hypothetical protein